MPKQKKNKAWLSFSLSPAERLAFEEKFKSSTCRSRNQYFRSILLDLPVTIKHRNASMDDYIREMLSFKKELQALRNDPAPPNMPALEEKVETILLYVEKQYRIWSHT